MSSRNATIGNISIPNSSLCKCMPSPGPNSIMRSLYYLMIVHLPHSCRVVGNLLSLFMNNSYNQVLSNRRVLPAAAFDANVIVNLCNMAVVQWLRHAQIPHGMYSSAYLRKMNREAPYGSLQFTVLQNATLTWVHAFIYMHPVTQCQMRAKMIPKYAAHGSRNNPI